MAFFFLDSPGVVADPIGLEQSLLAQASTPVTQLWQSGVALMVPRSYRNAAGFAAACKDFAARGCPVHVRASGGGLVPLDSGVLNLSLVYPAASCTGNAVERVYEHLCALLATALAPLGLQAQTQEVPGSFCDGRFNLAVRSAAGLQKIAGTAQYWHLPQGGQRGDGRYRVLAHALLLVAPDLTALHRRANAFEAQLGSGRVYTPAATTSIAHLLDAPDGTALLQTLRANLQQALTGSEPPFASSLPAAPVVAPATR